MKTTLESSGGVESEDTQRKMRTRSFEAPSTNRAPDWRTGPLDSFISFQTRYVLRLMLLTFVVGFVWATLTWLARVTQGQTFQATNELMMPSLGTNKAQTVGEFVRKFLSNNASWTTDLHYYTNDARYIRTYFSNSYDYTVWDSNSVIHSEFEPIITKTNGRWRITFKP